MPLEPKRTAVRLLTRHPIYRILPSGALRTCGALLYHAEHSSQDRVVAVSRSLGAIPTGRLALAVVAAKAAFRTGQDDLVEPAVAKLEQRFPEAAEPHVLRSDLHAYSGRYEEAHASAERARIVEPSFAPATARVVRLGYLVRDRDQADEVAATAVARFPWHQEVLWAVCKACDSPQQYARIKSAWSGRARQPADLARVVRPLSLAAARSGEIGTAIELYRQVWVALHGRRPQGGRVKDIRLGSRGAGVAIADIQAALDDAGVPFFFAAGTALGLVREGHPLSGDSDIDVGIFEADWDRGALLDLFTRHPRFDLDLHPQTQKISLKHRGGSPVDIFPFYQEDGRLWHDGVFVRWHNSPFQVRRREIRGRRTPLPDDVERYLTENYGDWRKPNPTFDAFTDDSPNMEVTWPEYHRLHLVRRAYIKLSSGDVGGARHELRVAGEGELANGTRRAQSRVR